jgi:glycosyltransferase involved in cell wall biosynthesis
MNGAAYSPSVSVVVPVLDGADTIGAMLSALMDQSGAPQGIEYIVVDNGSTDATCAIVASFPKVTLLHEARRGPAAARNCGLRAARGEIVVHLDADTLPTRRWLGAIVAPFKDPNVAIAVGQTLVFRPSTPVERYIAAAGLYESERAISRPPFPFAPSLNMAVRRTLALEAGGWCEDLMTAEDVDFSQRVLALAPGPIAYAASAVLFHRTRSTGEQLAKLASSYGRGVAQMYERYPERARWDFGKDAIVARRMAVRAVQPPLLRIGRALGLVDAERLEFAIYHRLWSWHFSAGFLRQHYGRTLGWRIARRVRDLVREPGEIVLAMRIGYFLWRAPYALARTHVHEYLSALERERRRKRDPRPLERQLALIERTRRLWLRMPFFRNRDSCYLRSLTLYRFLDVGEEPMHLHFAVEERDDARERRRAHVWISVAGKTYEGPPQTTARLREVTLSQALG